MWAGGDGSWWVRDPNASGAAWAIDRAQWWLSGGPAAELVAGVGGAAAPVVEGAVDWTLEAVGTVGEGAGALAGGVAAGVAPGLQRSLLSSPILWAAAAAAAIAYLRGR